VSSAPTRWSALGARRAWQRFRVDFMRNALAQRRQGRPSRQPLELDAPPAMDDAPPMRRNGIAILGP
jgi:hypothetical protein